MARQPSRRTLTVRTLVITGAITIVAALIVFGPRKQEPDGSTMLAGQRQKEDLSDALVKLEDAETSELGRSESIANEQAAPEPSSAETAPEKEASRPSPETRPADSTGAMDARQAYRQGVEARQRNELLEARTLLNRALQGDLPDHHAETARKTLRELGARTLFSRAILHDDPLVSDYVVKWGDNLSKIAQTFDVSEDILAEVNQLPNKNFIRQGQRLKVLHGPFHTMIIKKQHLMHVYLQDTYVETFRVALGVNGGTPTGVWMVKDQLVNPSWVDPRTGQRWHADDPQNPIGEYWIGIEGVEGEAIGQFGYGIHGTIEPETIGQDVSLGCVRLAADDIARVFRMLVPGKSRVTIRD